MLFGVLYQMIIKHIIFVENNIELVLIYNNIILKLVMNIILHYLFLVMQVQHNNMGQIYLMLIIQNF